MSDPDSEGEESTYRRWNNGEFTKYLEKCEAEICAHGEQEKAVRQQRQEDNVALFLDTCTKAVEQYQDRSRWFWYYVIAVEWCRQRIEAIVCTGKRVSKRT
jgi:hypothetical protein